MRDGRLAIVFAAGLCAMGLMLPGSAQADQGCGFLAVGVPDENVGAISNGGAVNVFYGEQDWGQVTTGSQLWAAGDADLEVTNLGGEGLGTALAVGDFNRDSYHDLAIGAPGMDVSGQNHAGAVQVLLGRDGPLSGIASQLWHQDVEDGPITVQGAAEEWDHFGGALAVGDFDGDGYDDLAVGAPGEDVGTYDTGAGAVNIFYGSDDGLGIEDNQMYTEDNLVTNGSEDDDHFGASLATGDFDGDGYDDLAIGVPGQDYDNNVTDTGQVWVLYGTASGLSTTGRQSFSQADSGIAETPEQYDYFGEALAVGDFDGDGYDDLAIGVPGEGVTSSGAYEEGLVHVLYGSLDTGLSTIGDQILSQDPLEGDPYVEDRLGAALATGDFDGDGADDLAIGVPGDIVEYASVPHYGAGAVNVIYGLYGVGLATAGNQLWHQASFAIDSDPASDDGFGSALAVGDFECDGYDDLSIGVPGENPTPGNPTGDAGAVHTIYGTDDGLDNYLAYDNFWYQGRSGVPGSAEQMDHFGSALAAMRVTHLFIDGFESGNGFKWSYGTFPGRDEE